MEVVYLGLMDLVLNNYLMVNGKEVLNSYSQVDYRYNPKSSNSLANYLNNKYLTSLPYQGIININSWKNSNYDLDNEDNYNNMFSNVVNAKVGLLSIGDIIVNNDLLVYLSVFNIVGSIGDIDLYTGFSLSHTATTYHIYIWLDGNLADNDYVNLPFSGYIHASATQTES